MQESVASKPTATGRGRAAIAGFARRPVVRAAGWITLGTVAGQIVLLATTPLLSRLFTPAAFGHLAILANVSTIGGAVAALCYPVSIFLPASERMAAAVFRLSLYLAVPGSLICTGVYAALMSIGGHGASTTQAVDLVLVCLGILLTSFFTSFVNAEIRANRFRPIALSKFNNSAAPALAQVGLGLAGQSALGLPVGRILGQTGTIGLMLWGQRGRWAVADLLRPRWLELRAAARRFRDAPLHVPRVLAVRSGTSLPATLLLAAYGPVVAGLYYMAERLIERPGALLGDTLVRLPMKVFAERVRARQPVAGIALRYSLVCAALILPPILLIALVGPRLIGPLLGEAWTAAGPILALLAISSGVRMACLPINGLIPVLRIHSWSMFIDFAFVLRLLLIPLAAAAGYGPTTAISALIALTVSYYLMLSVVCYFAAKGHDHRLAVGAAS